MARAAVKIDCTACDQTGYENYFTTTTIRGYYSPRAVRRWNKEAGALSYAGQASVKVDGRYAGLLRRATHVSFNDTPWNFSYEIDPGAGMGQHRLILSVTRKV